MNTTWVRYANRPSEIPWSGSKLTEMEELLQKVQQLETENADISHAYGVTRDVVKGLCEELANLKAENAALLADAERYRWIKRDNIGVHDVLELFMSYINCDLDKEIDQTRAKEGQP